jgi:UDP-2,3-diacylglucosamine hydrolase
MRRNDAGNDAMKAIFLSDVHLYHPADANYLKFMSFLAHLRGRQGTDAGEEFAGGLEVDHLILAGDFFDFWFGRGDRIYPGFRPVVDRLIELKASGVRISFCEGNHDFFLSDYFSRKLGMDVYPEEAEFELDGVRMMVSHGDTIDRANRKHLALRRFLRSAGARRLQDLLPRAVAWRLARISSKLSKEILGASQERLADLMHRFALDKFHDGYDAVILGHCHLIRLSETTIGGRKKTFAVLGDWVSHDSFLLFDDGRFALRRFRSA